MNTPNRRDFLKTAGASAAFMIAGSKSLRTYAANSKVQVALVGAGRQGSFHLRESLPAVENFQVVGIADVFAPNQKLALKYGQIANANLVFPDGQSFNDLTPETQNAVKSATAPGGFFDYREMLDILGDKIDALLVCTPPHTHHEIVMAGLDAGKWVFCEKILANTIKDCRDIVRKCHDMGKFVLVGHDRRYDARNNCAMNTVYNQRFFGRITQINAQWHRDSSWRRYWQEEFMEPDGTPYVLSAEEKKYIPDLERHLNWRMYSQTSGGIISELDSHHIDLSNWFLRGVPRRVYADAGLEYWRDGRETPDQATLVFDYEMAPDTPGYRTRWNEGRPSQQGLADGPYTVRSIISTTLTNAFRGDATAILGDNASLDLDRQKARLFFDMQHQVFTKDAGPAAEVLHRAMWDDGYITTSGSPKILTWAPKMKDGYELLASATIEPPNVLMFRDFADKIQNGGTPRVNQMDGLMTAIATIAALQSAKKRRPVDIDPAWYTFNFETPITGAYDYKPCA